MTSQFKVCGDMLIKKDGGSDPATSVKDQNDQPKNHKLIRWRFGAKDLTLPPTNEKVDNQMYLFQTVKMVTCLAC
jgi:hypothetical protein